MSGTCTQFVPKRKFADGHNTDGEQDCSAGHSAKIDDNAAFGDVWHATSGLEEGRAQHGHSSGAHSTPRNQCRDARVVAGVSGITESWGLKLLCYLLCLQGSDTEEKESRSSVTSSPNDKQIDPALWLWQSKQG